MCNVGDKIYIFGGQLDLNAKEDSGTVFILDTGMLHFGEKIPPCEYGNVGVGAGSLTPILLLLMSL